MDHEFGQKLHHKPKKIQLQDEAFLDHQDTHHSISLQKSRYLQVEDEVSKIFIERFDRVHRLKKGVEIQLNNFENSKGLDRPDEIEDTNEFAMRLKYCKEVDVQNQRRSILQFKCGFLAKIVRLRY